MAMETLYAQLEERTKERLETSPRGHQAGELEAMQIRIDKLEDALAHLMAWVAQEHRLREDEIESEGGIADF